MINVSLLLSGSVRKPGRLYPRPSSSLFQAFQISRKIRKILINTFLLHYTIIYHVKRLKYLFNKNTIWRKKFGGEISIKLSTSWCCLQKLIYYCVITQIPHIVRHIVHSKYYIKFIIASNEAQKLFNFLL